MTRKLLTSIIFKKELFRLDYYIIEEPSPINHKKTVYGIEICQSPLCSFCVYPYLNTRICDITDSKEEIYTFAKQLSDSSTDPVGLYDIIEDKI